MCETGLLAARWAASSSKATPCSSATARQSRRRGFVVGGRGGGEFLEGDRAHAARGGGGVLGARGDEGFAVLGGELGADLGEFGELGRASRGVHDGGDRLPEIRGEVRGGGDERESDDEKLAEEVEDLERLEQRLLSQHALDAHARRVVLSSAHQLGDLATERLQRHAFLVLQELDPAQAKAERRLALGGAKSAPNSAENMPMAEESRGKDAGDASRSVRRRRRSATESTIDCVYCCWLVVRPTASNPFPKVIIGY